MKISYILFIIAFLLTTLACSRFDLPRIQDKSIPSEIITLTPTPTATLIPNDENKNNGSAEDNVSNPKDTDSNIVSGNNDLEEKFVPVLDDLYIDNLFGFSIKYPSDWIVDSTKSVPSIAEIKLTPDDIIGDIYLLYTDGNLSNVDIVDQFISPIKQQPDFTILS